VIDALIGLGSNLGDREEMLARAVEALAREARTELVALSSLYETQPVGGPEQGAYLNAAAWLRTELAPRELLQRLLAAERALGRVRGSERNAPRTLDLDLLLCGDLIVDEPELRVPHPRLCERAFALEPLAEIAGERLHPERGESLTALAARVRDASAVRRFDSARWSKLRAQCAGLRTPR
jgi:2-amino-4-hydroxy-6-hydroxymethyldihydropteridine diphosphokinase